MAVRSGRVRILGDGFVFWGRGLRRTRPDAELNVGEAPRETGVGTLAAGEEEVGGRGDAAGDVDRTLLDEVIRAEGDVAADRGAVRLGLERAENVDEGGLLGRLQGKGMNSGRCVTARGRAAPRRGRNS